MNVILLMIQLTYQCNVLYNQLEINLSTKENMFWEIRDELIYGEQMQYQLLGDETNQFFNLKQQIEPYFSIHFPIQQQEILQIRTFQQFEFWLGELAILSKKNNKNFLYTLKNEILQQIELSYQCFDFSYLDQNFFIIECLVKNQLTLKIMNKDGIIVDTLITQIITNQKYNLEVKTIENGWLIFLYKPAFNDDLNIDDDSLIYVYKVIEQTIQQTEYYLNKQKLSNLFQNELKYFSILDIQIYSEKLYILDYRLGPILLQISNEGEFTQAKQITTSTLITQYYSFGYRKNDEDIMMTFGKNANQQMLVCNFINNKYDKTIKIFTEKTFILGKSILTLTPQYVILNTNNQLIIFTEEIIIQELDYSSSIFKGNLFLDMFVQVSNAEITYYEISTGYLKIKEQISVTEYQRYMKLIGYNKIQYCELNIILMIYDELDAQLYASYQDFNYYNNIQNSYEQEIIYYPSYPDLFYNWERITNGPNGQTKISLKNQQKQYDFPISSFQSLSLSGITQFDQNNVIFSLINHNGGINQYLIQTENLNGLIYECKLKELVQTCSQKITFYPIVKLTNDNIQWVGVSLYDSYMAIKSQNDHVITMYRVGQTTITQLFLIKTSLTDEKAKISDFKINSFNIYLLFAQLNILEIYSIKQKKILISIDNLPNPEKIYISNLFNKNLIFIQSENNIFLCHFYDEFNILSQFQVTNQIQVKMKLVILKSTIIIIYKTETEQGILQYSINDLNQVSLLRTIPIYYYQLLNNIQLQSNPKDNLILVNVYSPVTQTTVILVYRVKEMSRNALFASINTNNLIDTEFNMCVAGDGDNKIQFLYQNQVYSYVLFEKERLQIKQIFDQTFYQGNMTLIQEEWNEFYSKILVFKKEVIIVNMQLNLKWTQNSFLFEITEDDQDVVFPIQKDWLQGQRTNFKVSCIYCTTDNDSGQIYLLNQFQKCTSLKITQYIGDIINYNSSFIIFLTASVNNEQQSFFFMNSYGQITHQIYLNLQDYYFAGKLYKFNNSMIIVYTAQVTANEPMLYFYQFIEDQITFLGNITIEGMHNFIQMEYINNILITLEQNIENLPTIRFYYIVINENNVQFQPSNLVLNKYYFHRQFNVTSFEAISIENNQLLLFISEYSQGIVLIEIEIDKQYMNIINTQFKTQDQIMHVPELTIQKYEYLKINLKQYGLASRESHNLIQIQLYKIDNETLYFLLVDKEQESYLINININNYTLQILQVFQKFGNVHKYSQIAIIDQYLLQLYYIDYKLYYCLYEIAENEDITKNAQICKAGLKFEGNYNDLPNQFLFRKNQFGTYQLLTHSYTMNDYLYVYTFEKSANIIIRNTSNFDENTTFNLIVMNPYEQATIPVKFKIIKREIDKWNIGTMLLILVICFGVCLLSLIICALLQMYLNKHRKKKRRIRSSS